MDITLPQLGEGAESGTVVTIMVKVGDQVKKDQAVLELENEKAVAPIPSPASGTVSAIHVKVGDKVAVGQKLLTLHSGGTAVREEAAGPVAARRVSPRPVEPVAPPADEEDVTASPSGLAPAAPPSVRKVARGLGIDLRRVRGSEPGGRIAMADLRAYLQRLQQLAAAPAPALATGGPGRPAPVAVDFAKWGPVTKQPLTSLRQAVSKRMTASWTTVPHVTQFDEADLTQILMLKKKYEAAYEKPGGKLTPTPFILLALIDALKKHPLFNASLDEASGEVVLKRYYHIGIAVDTEAGLIVPVLRDVDKKSLLQLAKELPALAEKTRQRKITADELHGSTFTISNQGGIGGGPFTPIINVPDVAILGIGKAVQKPVVRDGRIEPRPMMPLGLSYDHRLIDGANAARFITDLVAAIEQFPESRVTL